MTVKEYQDRLYFLIKTMERPGINEFDRGYIQGLAFALLYFPDHFDEPVNSVNKEPFDFQKIKQNHIVKHKERGYGIVEFTINRQGKILSFGVDYESGLHGLYAKEDIHDFDRIGPWRGDEIQ